MRCRGRKENLKTEKITEISIFPEDLHEAIDPNIYGLHLEHIWNCVYPCIWVGRKSKIPNIDGIRKDVVTLLADLKPSVCKYPGGYFSDFYDWRDGVGKNRPVRVCPTQPGKKENNHFGTAEFVTLCRLIGAEPFFSVSTTSLQPNEAAQWVEYCNRPKDTFWAERRRKDGFKKPFNVHYWAIGNEQYWLHSAREYADRYKLWAHWMYNTDPDLTLVLSGIEPGIKSLERTPWNIDGKWCEDVLRLTNAGQGLFHGDWHSPAKDQKILYSIHPYFFAEPECTNEQYWEAFNDLDHRLPKSIEASLKLLDKYRGTYSRPRLCFDEYGLLHSGCSMTGNMTQPAPFWPALWLGCFFHICYRYPADIGMATLPGMINMEHALILIENGRAVTTPSYHAFKMLRPHGGGQSVKLTVKNKPACKCLADGPLRVLATRLEGQNRLTISCINLHLEQSVPVTINIRNGKIKKIRSQVLTGPLHARNSAEKPNRIIPIEVKSTIVKEKVIQNLPPHSLTVFDIHYT